MRNMIEEESENEEELQKGPELGEDFVNFDPVTLCKDRIVAN